MHVLRKGRATERRDSLSYDLWLEQSTYVTTLVYSGLIGVLLPLFHFILGALPGIPPDSLAIRLVCTAFSFIVAATLLLVPGARRAAPAFQVAQVSLAIVVIDALIIDSGDQNLYIASGLLVIIGAQNAFYSTRALAATLLCGFAFMLFYAQASGVLRHEDTLVTLAIFATSYVLAFIPASLHIRSEQDAIRARIRAQRATEDLEEAHALTHIGKWILNFRTGATECSDEVLRILGEPVDTPGEAVPGLYSRAIHPDDRASVENALVHAQRTGAEFSIDHRLVRADGSVRWVQLRGKHEYDARQAAVRRLGTVMDITARKEAAVQLERLARYDPLTSLPNRSMLHESLAKTLAEAGRENRICAVLFLDLDRFKDINDTHGHSLGDMLLKAVAIRLRSLLTEDALLVRWGGDEFVVVLDEADDVEAVEWTCAKLVQGLSEPFSIDEHSFAVTSTIGVAMFPRDGTDAEVLIRNADTAMYTIKDNSGLAYAFFTPDMHAEIALRHRIQNQLQNALATDSLALYYQPIVEAGTGRIVSAEALLRLIDADGTVRPPADFIGIAEDTGAIVGIGMWVVDRAVRQAMRWRAAGMEISVAVNISPRQLDDADFVEMLQHVLRENGADPSVLTIEITESGLLNAKTIEEKLARIEEMGVAVAVDDFGTGYSAFSYLKRFPLDTLKIDRTFVENIERDIDRSIVESIVAIAHRLRLSVTAEGVETEYQRTVLSEIGCNRLQGFQICKPVPAAEFETFASQTLSRVPS